MKNARHEQILLLVEKYEIETQEELAERLNEAGFTVTQATVSRDIPAKDPFCERGISLCGRGVRKGRSEPHVQARS